MDGSTLGATAARGCRRVAVGGVEVPVAAGSARAPARPRLPRPRARPAPGLLIPRCASVHTFGMRFALDLVFLDARRRPLAVRRGGAAAAVRLAPRRAAPCSSCRAPQGGEFAAAAA